MNSLEVFNLIEQVAATSSKNDKIALLTANRDDDLLKKALEYAYNPFKTYGIRKRPDAIGDHVGRDFDDGTFELLDDLITRKVTGTQAIEFLRGELTALSKESAELLWRIAMPLICLMQMLLAIPLGFVNPRRGRTLNLMIALVLSVAYSNAVGIMQAVVGQGKLSFSAGWWPLHAAALVAIMLLFVWRNNTNSAWHPARLLAILRRTLLPRKKEAA